MGSLRKDVKHGLTTRSDLRYALRAYDDIQTSQNRAVINNRISSDWVKEHRYFEDKLKLRRSEKGLRSNYKKSYRAGTKPKITKTQDLLLSDLGDSVEKKLNLDSFLSFTKLDVEPIGGGGYLYDHGRMGNLDMRGQRSTFESQNLSKNTLGYKYSLRYFGEIPPNGRENGLDPITIQSIPQISTIGFEGQITPNKFFFETPLEYSIVRKKNTQIDKSPTQYRHSLLQHYKNSLGQYRTPVFNTEDEIWSKIKITLLGLNAYPRFNAVGVGESQQEKSEYFISNAKKNFEKIRNYQLKSLMRAAGVHQFRVGISKSPNQFKHLRDDLKLTSTQTAV